VDPLDELSVVMPLSIRTLLARDGQLIVTQDREPTSLHHVVKKN
jgi:hypothetical protein